MVATVERPGVPMVTPAALKRFRRNFDTAKRGAAAALENLAAEDKHREASEEMRRTRLATMEVAEALLEMHESEDYRHDGFKDWSALCRGVKIPRERSYRLLAMARAARTLPEGAGELSYRKLLLLGEASPEQREETLAAAAETGDEDAAFDALKAVLRGASVDALEAPEAPKADPAVAAGGDLPWVRRTTTSLLNFFERRGKAERAMPLVQGLIQLARE
jgi:hypothetical protein